MVRVTSVWEDEDFFPFSLMTSLSHINLQMISLVVTLLFAVSAPHTQVLAGHACLGLNPYRNRIRGNNLGDMALGAGRTRLASGQRGERKLSWHQKCCVIYGTRKGAGSPVGCADVITMTTTPGP